jgi:hypothetical protein
VVAGAVALALAAVLVVWLLNGDDGDSEPVATSTTLATSIVSTSSSSVPGSSSTSTTLDGTTSTTVPPTGAPVPSTSTTTAPDDPTTSTTAAPDDSTAAENARLVDACLGGDVDACFEVGSRQLPPPGTFGGSKYLTATDEVVEQACFDDRIAAACYVAGIRGLPLVVG